MVSVNDSSILDDIKKTLSIDPSMDVFDQDILLHINTVFMTLNQLGVGPEKGYRIEDKTAKWVSYLGDDDNLNAVKSYMVLRVRLLFDPPATSFHIDSMEKQIAQLEWRLNVHVDTPRIPNED